MKRYDLIVIGAGPAGLSAAIEAAKCGMNVVVFDENRKPGGQLFKQIHKFFGSKEHRAKIRGFKIGEDLLNEAAAAGVKVVLNAIVIGLFPEKEVTVSIDDQVLHCKGDTIIIATGASENMVTFPGWTLPGVIGAGAAQTMVNLHGIMPGKKVLMLGSGNVGLVVSYQLLQAGCEVVAVVDAAPKIGGYGVHAAKLARCGVPFFLSHTIVAAQGESSVTGVTISAVDANFNPLPGSARQFDVDTICLAVGLSPMSQLCNMAGCEMIDDPTRAGYAPVVNAHGETTVSGIFAAGDVSGIEEASSAMIEGRIAGLAASHHLGYIETAQLEASLGTFEAALSGLRKGMFAPENRHKTLDKTDEGFKVSRQLLQQGYLNDAEISHYPGVVSHGGIHPVIECTQNIPCNPCQDACNRNCIKIGETITALPAVSDASTCSGCGMCVAACSGQAIFLVDEQPDWADITLPYEFLPLPKAGDRGFALGRDGQPLCPAEVVKVKTAAAFDQTHLLTMRVDSGFSMKARFYKGGQSNA